MAAHLIGEIVSVGLSRVFTVEQPNQFASRLLQVGRLDVASTKATIIIILGVLLDFADVVADSVCGDVKQEACPLQSLFGVSPVESRNIHCPVQPMRVLVSNTVLMGLGVLNFANG